MGGEIRSLHIGIDYFFFGLLCRSGVEWMELQQWALLGIIMPTHSVPSLGYRADLMESWRDDNVREVHLSFSLSCSILSV